MILVDFSWLQISCHETVQKKHFSLRHIFDESETKEVFYFAEH